MSNISIPQNPTIREQLKGKLKSLSPRAFELFAGDFLSLIGLDNVKVTRYVSDGGIDATANIVASGFNLRVAVQVKRYNKNVPRSDIDRFVGVLFYKDYSQGIFITTSGFADSANERVSKSFPSIFTMDGNNLVDSMIRYEVGIVKNPEDPSNLAVDDNYFESFLKEADNQTSPDKPNNENEDTAVKPENDLITLKTLSSLLRIDPDRTRQMIETGRLIPDDIIAVGQRNSYFFRRDRIDEIRTNLGLEKPPSTSGDWKQEFLDFMRTKKLETSYKPVLVKAIFKLADRNGLVKLQELVQEFALYYINRKDRGLPVEFNNSTIINVQNLTDKQIEKVIREYPLNRLEIRHFVLVDKINNVVQINPYLWADLRAYEVIDIITEADKQLKYYFCDRFGSVL